MQNQPKSLETQESGGPSTGPVDDMFRIWLAQVPDVARGPQFDRGSKAIFYAAQCMMYNALVQCMRDDTTLVEMTKYTEHVRIDLDQYLVQSAPGTAQ